MWGGVCGPVGGGSGLGSGSVTTLTRDPYVCRDVWDRLIRMEAEQRGGGTRAAVAMLMLQSGAGVGAGTDG